MNDATAHISEKVRDTMARHNCTTLTELCDLVDKLAREHEEDRDRLKWWIDKSTANHIRATAMEFQLGCVIKSHAGMMDALRDGARLLAPGAFTEDGKLADDPEATP